MSDVSVAEIPVADEIPVTNDDPLPLRPIAAPAKNALVDGPVLHTLLWLAWPNIIALSAGTCVVLAETFYIGRLGTASMVVLGVLSAASVVLTRWGPERGPKGRPKADPVAEIRPAWSGLVD